MKTPLRLALVAIAGAVALSGCMRFTADLRLEPDNTVDGTYVIAVAEGTGDELGISDRETAQKLYDDSGLAAGLQHSMQRVYSSDGYSGLQVKFRGEELARFSPTSERFGITREGDEFVVSGPSSDVSEEDAAALKGADLRVSIEFPGPVTESNGTVDGNTVTWDLIGGPDELTARGSAVPSGSPMSAILATIVVLGAAGALVYSRIGASGTAARPSRRPAGARQPQSRATGARPSAPPVGRPPSPRR